MGDRFNYLNLSELHALRAAIRPIADVWDATPYLVGSVLTTPNYRDVDVRLLLPDKKVRKYFRKRSVLLLANLTASAWLERLTGLPIDFQYQPRSEWADYNDAQRQPLKSVIHYANERLLPKGDAA